MEIQMPVTKMKLLPALYVYYNNTLGSSWASDPKARSQSWPQCGDKQFIPEQIAHP
jgi:hypothetical protein